MPCRRSVSSWALIRRSSVIMSRRWGPAVAMEASSRSCSAASSSGVSSIGPVQPRGARGVRPGEAGAMAAGLVLPRLVSERGVHETAQRAGGAGSSAVVRHYVGYEERKASAFLRREAARHGVALILGFGDSMEVFADEVGGPVRTLGAFVVGNQSGSSLTGVRGHQLGVQGELTPAGALALFGGGGVLNGPAVPPH